MNKSFPEFKLGPKIENVGVRKVKIRKHNFWGKRVEEVVIPYQWEALNDRIPEAPASRAMENFCITVGPSKGEFHGFWFQDSDLAKWLEAVSHCLMKRNADELPKPSRNRRFSA